MRSISLPNYDPQVVYRLCIDSISDVDLRGRLASITELIVNAANDYHQRGAGMQLYLIAPILGKDDVVVVADVTKAELKSTYSSHMVGASKPARLIYDELVATAPRRRCPFCGIGHASTLDHYLPKSKYPLLSVLPWNLVPACKDCNTGKNASMATSAGEQTLHPYFEQAAVVREQWLFAGVVPGSPPMLEFRVAPPAHWNDVLCDRVSAHFTAYDLASRYSVECGNELASLKDTLSWLWERAGAEGVRLQLQAQAVGKFSQNVNSWDTAMYQALASCEWYYNGGFLDF